MKLEFLTDEGLDKKYYQWKEVITQSIIKPVLDIKDGKATIQVFIAKTTADLLDEIDKDTLRRIDQNYSCFFRDETAFLIKLIDETELDMMKEYGFKNPSNEVFTVFKDELLKANPITVLRKFEVLDWKIQLQKRIQLN